MAGEVKRMVGNVFLGGGLIGLVGMLGYELWVLFNISPAIAITLISGAAFFIGLALKD